MKWNAHCKRSCGVDSNTRLHVFAINRMQTKSTLIAAFKDWIEQQTDISGKESLRGRAGVQLQRYAISDATV